MNIMKLKYLDELYPEKVKEKEDTLVRDDFGLGFIPSSETVKAIEDAKKLSSTQDGAYSDFDSFWKDLMADED